MREIIVREVGLSRKVGFSFGSEVERIFRKGSKVDYVFCRRGS